MKKIILIIVALAVLGGGGFAGWYFFMKPKGDEKPKEIKIEELSAAELTKLTYKMPEKMEISSNTSDDSNASLKIDVVFDSEGAKKEFEERSSQMHSTILDTVRSLSSEQLSGVEGKKLLEKTLKDKFNSWMKEGKVLTVFTVELAVH